ncbi:hypothetical protein BN946_scf185014.g49 [Trametes cinnabarina]|uniref:Uncharacterized protein n=1 Tax=Pycnoporus cinnabarinus TaxID=5643 RepID=A0A060SMW1_PYCCI|nr:hypothetical protein BN946_scf185014.g49 [Trametes cinnabarina]
MLLISLRIFPPNASKASSSLASLSSADENYGTWDLTSDPHVTRSAQGRLSRSHSYNNFADDESSDASTSAGFPDGCGIQGLDAEDCDVSWVPGLESKWTIGGDVGFTGYATGPPPTPPLSRQSSVDNPSIYALPSSPNGRAATNGHAPMRFDSSSSTSSLLRAPLPAQNVAEYSFETSPASTPISSLASLPLPSSPEQDRRSRASSINGRYMDVDTDHEEDAAHLPKVPITIHLNMNDLLPPAKQDFKFRISGTVLVTPRKPVLVLSSRRYKPSPTASQHPSEDEAEPDVVVIPRFRVLCADKEHISCTIQSDVNDAMVDIYNTVGDIRNAQTRKTVLQKGGQVKCGTDGARVALRPVRRSPSLPARARGEESVEVSRRSRSRHRATNGVSHREQSPSVIRQSFLASSMRMPVQRDGPLLIPSVNVTVSPLPKENMSGPPDYAVRVDLPALTEEGMEWLEFGLAHPNADSGASTADGAPKIEIVSASLEGVSVRFVTSRVVKPETGGTVPFGEASGKQWVTWVRVHLGDALGGKVEIIYLVKGRQMPLIEQASNKRKEPVPEPIFINALLPSFSLRVGVLEVNVLLKSGFEIASTKTNLSIERPVSQGLQLLHYALEEYFYPRLLIEMVPSRRDSQPSHTAALPSRPSWGWSQITVTLLLALISILQGLERFRTLSSPSVPMQPDISQAVSSIIESPLTEIITVTTTVAPSSTRWYFPDPETPSQVVSSIAAADATKSPSSSATPPSLTEASLTPTPIASPTPDDSIEFWDRVAGIWSLHFELSAIEFPQINVTQTTTEVLQRVLESICTVYDLLRRVARYPMDPTSTNVC